MKRSTCTRRILRRASVGALCLAPWLFITGCQPSPIDDPIAVLRNPGESPRRLVRAMEMTDAAPTEGERLEALHRMLYMDGFTTDVREQALNRLAEVDLDNLKRTLRQRYPRLEAWSWLTRLSEIIVERRWADLAPALISSWARPSIYVNKDSERPEYIALVGLFGEKNVPDVVFDTLLEANAVHEQGLRTRCWTLMNRLGHYDRLVALLLEREVPADDVMLLDLQAAARELGVVPRNREEILWARQLRMPEHASFWNQAASAVARLPVERRRELELRDLAIIVSASLHQPELLTLGKEELYRRVDAHLESTQRHIASRSFDGWDGNFPQRLHEHRDQLTWGDLAAMLIAVRAMQTPEIVTHLFDFADRDLKDKTTEYGGVITLDARNRFELIEFPPRVRFGDLRFNAPQAMFDAGYTGVFHLHFHAQKYDNAEYAGPGMGDLQYADETRANCLVLTFISQSRMNIDYYRHGRLIVDLGEIRRPSR